MMDKKIIREFLKPDKKKLFIFIISFVVLAVVLWIQSPTGVALFDIMQLIVLTVLFLPTILLSSIFYESITAGGRMSLYLWSSLVTAVHIYLLSCVLAYFYKINKRVKITLLLLLLLMFLGLWMIGVF